MIALDTNILVYSHRDESPHHRAALNAVAALAAGSMMWAIPWPCIHEFLNVVTNPRIFARPTPLKRAVEQVSEWMLSPTLALPPESQAHWKLLQEILLTSHVTGPRVHDARIVALCIQHGELWSADRDFSRFPRLRVVNPLLG
jgi:toxin-antitoxin system PIN domain toxin